MLVITTGGVINEGKIYPAGEQLEVSDEVGKFLVDGGYGKIIKPDEKHDKSNKGKK